MNIYSILKCIFDFNHHQQSHLMKRGENTKLMNIEFTFYCYDETKINTVRCELKTEAYIWDTEVAIQYN